MTHKVSVAMCTYNGEKYLKEQLESIASQVLLPHSCCWTIAPAMIQWECWKVFAKICPLRFIYIDDKTWVYQTSKSVKLV